MKNSIGGFKTCPKYLLVLAQPGRPLQAMSRLYIHWCVRRLMQTQRP